MPRDYLDYIDLGHCFYDKGKFKASTMVLTKAINLDPLNPLAYNNRAFAKENLNDLEGALNDFNKSIELDPKNPLAWENRAIHKLERDLYHDSVKDFIESINICPCIRNYLKIVDIYRFLKEEDKAQDYFKLAAKRFENLDEFNEERHAFIKYTY